MKKFILAMVTVFALSMVAFADDTTPPADAGNAAGTPPAAASNKMATKTTKAKKKHTKGAKKAKNKMSDTGAAGGAQ